ncbi:MAG: ATP synthase subunit I [Candidatus Acidiferrales bacterium]
MAAAMAADDDFYAAAERRIEYVSLGFAAAGTAIAWFAWGGRPAAGFASGAALSWINYRWMKQGVGTLARLSVAQAGSQRAQVPASVYFKFIGRYALLIVAAYAILRSFKPPAASLLAGFFTVIAAVLVEMVGQLFRTGPPPPHADS